MLSGYRSERWGLGEIEAFGSGATMLPEDEPNHVTSDATDLRPGTTYHYRLVATNSRGTTLGPDRTHTTPPDARPLAATGGATRIASTSARLEGRINDGRKIWKLSPMDLESYGRWYDYSRARDDMFSATDSSWAPWYVVRSDDKERARLNVISHLLKQIPYKETPRDKIKLPKRQKAGSYKDANYPFKFIPEKY